MKTNKNKKIKGGADEKTVWTWSIIGGIILIILLIIAYVIFNTCYKETGEYGYIGKSCFEKIKEMITGKYRLDMN